MDVLNDDCLLYIFEKLGPKEWAPMTEVCTRWQDLLSSVWKKIDRLDIAFESRIYLPEYIQYLTMEKVMQIIEICGQNITRVRLSNQPECSIREYSIPEYMRATCCIKVGSYDYILKDYNPNAILRKVYEISENIVALDLGHLQLVSMKLIKRICTINKGLKTMRISKTTFKDDTDEDNCENVSNSIEELVISQLQFIYPASIKCINAYKWMFTNLVTLKFRIDFNNTQDLFLNELLPCTTNLRYLRVSLFSMKESNTTFLSVIPSLVHLEEFYFEVNLVASMFLDNTLIQQIVSNCIKLRVLEIRENVGVNNASMKSLMSLPNLEVLRLLRVKEFKHAELPIMNHLTEFSLKLAKNNTCDFETLCSAIENMPALSKLYISGLNEEESLKLTYRTICTVISQNKMVTISDRIRYIGSEYINVFKQNNVSSVLNVSMNQKGTNYYQDIIKFVKNNLKTSEELLLGDVKVEDKNLKYEYKVLI